MNKEEAQFVKDAMYSIALSLPYNFVWSNVLTSSYEKAKMILDRTINESMQEQEVFEDDVEVIVEKPSPIKEIEIPTVDLEKEFDKFKRMVRNRRLTQLEKFMENLDEATSPLSDENKERGKKLISDIYKMKTEI